MLLLWIMFGVELLILPVLSEPGMVLFPCPERGSVGLLKMGRIVGGADAVGAGRTLRLGEDCVFALVWDGA